MNLRKYFSSLVFGLAALTASAASINTVGTSISDTITDSHIVFPSSLDTDVNILKNNWYMKRYAVLDSVGKRKSGAKLSDEEYKKRLQRLPNVIEMPYNSIVKAYIEMYAVRKPELVENMLGMSLYYMPIFEEALEKYSLPVELKYLPVIESALNPNAVSKAGAAGLWQFMSATATGEGLEVNSLIDERRDPIAASDAAARYLKTLHSIYNDWPLAIAAYNCGPGNVNKAIKRAGDVNDYWAIYKFLPEETRGYVPAFIAANYIMNYYGEHGISPALARKPIVTDTVHVNHKVHFQQISDVMGLPIEELRTLNPQYRQDIIPGNMRPCHLILPSVQAYCYVANVDTIYNHKRDLFFTREEVEPYTPEVASLDNNSKPAVAPAPSSKPQAKSQSNNKSNSKSKNNSKDNKNSKNSKNKKDNSKNQKTTTHTVKSGESLDKIARKHGTTVDAIKKANNLKSNTIHPQQKLKIPSKK